MWKNCYSPPSSANKVTEYVTVASATMPLHSSRYALPYWSFHTVIANRPAHRHYLRGFLDEAMGARPADLMEVPRELLGEEGAPGESSSHRPTARAGASLLCPWGSGPELLNQELQPRSA